MFTLSDTFRLNAIAVFWSVVLIAILSLAFAVAGTALAWAMATAFHANGASAVFLLYTAAASALAGAINGFLLIASDWRAFRDAACPPEPAIRVQTYPRPGAHYHDPTERLHRDGIL